MLEVQRLEQVLRHRLAFAFSLEPLTGDRLALLTPFTFGDGDRFPIVIERNGSGWRLTDDGRSAAQLLRVGPAVSDDARSRLLDGVARQHDLKLSGWALTKSVEDPPTADDVLGFIHAVVQVAEANALSEAPAPSSFQDELYRFLRDRVRPSQLFFGWTDVANDPHGDFPIDAVLRPDDGDPLFCFGVADAEHAKDVVITLLTFEKWRVPFGSMVVFERQADMDRRSLALLTDLVDKQFASLRGNEERIVEYVRRRGVEAPEVVVEEASPVQV